MPGDIHTGDKKRKAEEDSGPCNNKRRRLWDQDLEGETACTAPHTSHSQAENKATTTALAPTVPTDQRVCVNSVSAEQEVRGQCSEGGVVVVVASDGQYRRVSVHCTQQSGHQMASKNVTDRLHQAAMSDKWKEVETIASTEQISLRPRCRRKLRGVVRRAVRQRQFCALVAMLKPLPVGISSVPLFYRRVHTEFILASSARKSLARVCQLEGLMDWALVLRADDYSFVKAHHAQCGNDAVVNFLLSSCFFPRTLLTLRLAERCRDSYTLANCLDVAVDTESIAVVKAVIDRVDSVAYRRCHEYQEISINMITLYCHPGSWQRKAKITRLLIASGHSTFVRQLPVNEMFKWYASRILFHPSVMHMFLESGAWSHRALHAIRSNISRPPRRSVSEQWKESHRIISEAAATPLSLLQMARLAVSHNVGIDPGRRARIDQLPVPQLIRDFVSFKTITG